jgi:hypothetical protein
LELACRNVASSPALLALGSEATMPILEQAKLLDLAGVGGVKKKK